MRYTPVPLVWESSPGWLHAHGGVSRSGALYPSLLHCTAILYPTSVSEIMFFCKKMLPKYTELNLNKAKIAPRLTTTTTKNYPGFPPASSQASSMTCGQRFSSVESTQTSLVKETPVCFNTYGFLLYVPIKILEV